MFGEEKVAEYARKLLPSFVVMLRNLVRWFETGGIKGLQGKNVDDKNCIKNGKNNMNLNRNRRNIC